MVHKQLAGYTDLEPIEAWKNLIQLDLSEKEAEEALRYIYRIHEPHVAELILESYCPNTCRHCIYPPDYNHFNVTLSEEQWADVLETLYTGMNFRRYVFSGRSLNKKSLNVIKSFRVKFSDVTVGVIADGNSLESMTTDIIELAPDWIDISVDGMEKAHELQRNRPGSFEKTVRVLKILRDSEAFRRISVLTCLTTLTMDSVLDMIHFLNREGFKNFFLTPLTVMQGYRPQLSLKPKIEEFIGFIDVLISRLGTLNDTWVEVDLYETGYAGAIKSLRPQIFDQFKMNDEHLELMIERGDNEFHLDYYPSSLTGLRELIVNSDGNIITPRVMGMGKIPDEFVFGNLLELKKGTNLVGNLIKQKAFSFYVSELLEEMTLLR
jgi:sulfatase maturation enzyme AslB (radical SAM superfamily)